MSHKQALTAEQLAAVTAEAFGPGAVLQGARELGEGTFNTAYALRLGDGREAVLKVAPPAEAPVLTYEHDLLSTEALALSIFGQRTSVPVPRLLHDGTGSTALSRPYVMMSALPGASWTSQAHALTSADRQLLRHQLGGHVAAMHGVTGEDLFGYPAPNSPLTGTTWTQAYMRIIGALVADAEQFGSPLPMPAAEIHNRLAEASEAALAAVRVPVLVHFDLWDGNIFIDASPQGPVITGLIDHERALWGDPAADFASLALLGDIVEDADFLAGYQDAGGPVVLDAATRLRMHLYRAHLALVMLVETVPRGTAGPQHKDHNAAVARWFTRQLDSLDAALRAGA